MRLLWAVDHGLQSVSKRMRQELGVTGPQRLVVRIVGKFPGIGAKELADILHVHPSTLTGVLRRLEERGLIARQPDPSDGRRALLNLTGLGNALNRTSSETVEARVRAALARQPGRRIEDARAVLQGLVEELMRHRGR